MLRDLRRKVEAPKGLELDAEMEYLLGDSPVLRGYRRKELSIGDALQAALWHHGEVYVGCPDKKWLY